MKSDCACPIVGYGSATRPRGPNTKDTTMYDLFITVKSDSVAVYADDAVLECRDSDSLLEAIEGKSWICSASMDFPEEYTENPGVLSLVNLLMEVA